MPLIQPPEPGWEKVDSGVYTFTPASGWTTNHVTISPAIDDTSKHLLFVESAGGRVRADLVNTAVWFYSYWYLSSTSSWTLGVLRSSINAASVPWELWRVNGSCQHGVSDITRGGSGNFNHDVTVASASVADSTIWANILGGGNGNYESQSSSKNLNMGTFSLANSTTMRFECKVTGAATWKLGWQLWDPEG